MTRRGFVIAAAHPRLNLRELASEDGEYLDPLQDIAEAQHREVTQHRFTSLDRSIARDKPIDGQARHFQVSRNSSHPRNQYAVARLRTLEGMGLAQTAGLDQWLVRQDFETALRAMQRLGDRQKILAAHGVPVSDTRLPLAMFGLRHCTTLEGRIPVHLLQL